MLRQYALLRTSYNCIIPSFRFTIVYNYSRFARRNRSCVSYLSLSASRFRSCAVSRDLFTGSRSAFARLATDRLRERFCGILRSSYCGRGSCGKGIRAGTSEARDFASRRVASRRLGAVVAATSDVSLGAEIRARGFLLLRAEIGSLAAATWRKRLIADTLSVSGSADLVLSHVFGQGRYVRSCSPGREKSSPSCEAS